HSLEKAQRDKSLLRVVEAVIFVGVRRTGEDFRRIDKVEAMQVKIGFALGLTPRESHDDSVYTERPYVKERLCVALTNQGNRRPPRREAPPVGVRVDRVVRARGATAAAKGGQAHRADV